ncbi:hypothetical protein CsSME_00002997 [Camellia sinensis var. sinensis]
MLISYFLFLVILQFIPTTLTLDSGVTRPPSLLSEADLLNCMDKAGIGTDATMHDHIKKLLDRFYATKDSNTRFSPTNLFQTPHPFPRNYVLVFCWGIANQWEDVKVI